MSNTKRALRALNDNVWQPIVDQEKKRHKHVATKLFTQPFKVATGQSESDNEGDILPRNKTAPSSASNDGDHDSIQKEVSNSSDKEGTLLSKKVRFKDEGAVEDSANDVTDEVVESDDWRTSFGVSNVGASLK